jgi:hypothetical protein
MLIYMITEKLTAERKRGDMMACKPKGDGKKPKGKEHTKTTL